MELTRAPPPDVNTARPEAASARGQEASPAASAPPPIAADRVDIRPLDLVSALQILIAEVRAELQLPVDVPRSQSPAQTAQIVLHLLLEALPGPARMGMAGAPNPPLLAPSPPGSPGRGAPRPVRSRR